QFRQGLGNAIPAGAWQCNSGRGLAVQFRQGLGNAIPAGAWQCNSGRGLAMPSPYVFQII
ncbi:MAG: hypothetical protein ACFE0I_18995, partial [Elainellaceae cyanobacterium]